MQAATPDRPTPEAVYFNRRALLRAGVLAGSAAGTAMLYRLLKGGPMQAPETAAIEGLAAAEPASADSGFFVDEPKTSLEAVTNYNNFYEFTTDKSDVARVAKGFTTEGWTITVDGLVNEPRVFTMEDLRALAPLEERVYRMRCVEAWSMVIPWAGIPLASLIAAVGPMAGAKYVAFETLLDPERMPGQKTTVLEWPYVEGLRLDEAMHPLTLLATGLYGRELPPQDGAPVRLVVPWKYGFKGIKSIVKISLVSDQPKTTWNALASDEYGFYANVNPEVDHPRWSQATEQRISESGRRDTLPFNGYADQVASLYEGLDLRVNF
jgi:methionine sulfoxide reductase catalytic subunit